MFTFHSQKNIFLAIVFSFKACVGMTTGSVKPSLTVTNNQVSIIVIHEFDRVVGGSDKSRVCFLGLQDSSTFHEKDCGWLYDMSLILDGQKQYIGSLNQPGHYSVSNGFYRENNTSPMLPFIGIKHCLYCSDKGSFCDNCVSGGMIFFQEKFSEFPFHISLNNEGPLYHRLGCGRK